MPAGVRYPTPPAPGQPVSATLLRDIIACLKSITPINGRNTTVDYGTYGARVNCTPAGSSAKPAGNPLFAIGTMKKDGETVKAIVNCWYMRGGLLCHDPDYELPNIAPDKDEGEDEGDEEERLNDGFICFRTPVSPFASEAGLREDEWYEEHRGADEYKPPSTGIVFYKSVGELSDRQKEANFYTYPLYKIGKNGGVDLDLRPLINIQVFDAI